MKQAFTYMFLDNKFWRKAALFLIPVFILLYSSCFGIKHGKGVQLNTLDYYLLFGLLLIIKAVYDGYRITNIKSLLTTSDLKILPYMTLKKNFIEGIKYQIAFSLFFLPWSLIIGIFAFSYSFSYMIGMPEQPVIIFFILSSMTILFYTIYIAVFLPASMLAYIKTNNILAFYNFEEILKTFYTNKKKYITSVILYVLLGFFMGLMYTLSLKLSASIYSVPLIIIPAIVCVYIFFVQNKLIANIAETD